MTQQQDASLESGAATKRMRRFATTIGLLSLGVGLLVNPWTLGAVAGSGGAVGDPADRFVIYCFQAIMLCWGGVNLLFRSRAIVAKLNLMLASLLLVSPLLAEVALRTAIAMRVPSVCDAGLFFDALSEDEYWIFAHVWSGPQGGDRVIFDRELGWAPEKTDANPLGAYSPTEYRMDEIENPVFVFGDSFIDSPAGIEYAIPAIMDAATSRTVFNLGVSGHGVDQIYLRMKQVTPVVSRSTNVMGVLTSDLDRSILRFRGAAKPRYQEEPDGGLQLETLGDADEDIDGWIARNPPTVGSYLLAFGRMRFRLHMPGEFREHSFRRTEKEQLNRRILEEVKRSRRPDDELLVVVFYEPEELGVTGWRETFLLAELKRLQLPYLDTKPLLLEAAGEQGVKQFYRPDHHLNRAGNQLVAKRLLERLRLIGSP